MAFDSLPPPPLPDSQESEPSNKAKVLVVSLVLVFILLIVLGTLSYFNRWWYSDTPTEVSSAPVSQSTNTTSVPTTPTQGNTNPPSVLPQGITPAPVPITPPQGTTEATSPSSSSPKEVTTPPQKATLSTPIPVNVIVEGKYFEVRNNQVYYKLGLKLPNYEPLLYRYVSREEFDKQSTGNSFPIIYRVDNENRIWLDN